MINLLLAVVGKFLIKYWQYVVLAGILVAGVWYIYDAGYQSAKEHYNALHAQEKAQWQEFADYWGERWQKTQAALDMDAQELRSELEKEYEKDDYRCLVPASGGVFINRAR